MQITLTKDDFLNSTWRDITANTGENCHFSLSQAFNKEAETYAKCGEVAKSKIMQLLAQACSMMIDAKSINEPFRPIFQDFQENRRSSIPDDFTATDLAFFDIILEDVDHLWLMARLADILWLCRKPKTPNHAIKAIDGYTAHPINPENWRGDIENCWERAGRLCLQIGDYVRLGNIEEQLFSAFKIDQIENLFMPLWLAQMLDRLGLGKAKYGDIAERLFSLAQGLQAKGNFEGARSYFELAGKKFKQNKNEPALLGCLILIAECFEQEAGQRVSGTLPSQIIANSFYEKAIQAYRRIPVKHRATHDVDNKLLNIQNKLRKTGEASLGEMGLVQTPGIDIKSIVEDSKSHVSGKPTLEIALMYFIGLYGGPSYDSLKQSAEESMKQNIFSSLFSSTHFSADGRIVARTPAISFVREDEKANQEVLARQIQQHFSIEMQLLVESQILPALHQILMEHRVTHRFLEELCYHSPFVPPNRQKLTAAALWLGFEYDFANAVHLLCPQLEHMVRTQLKNSNAQTSNVDPNGIENENGLSTLLDLPETHTVLGKGYKLRNKGCIYQSPWPQPEK